MSSKGLGSDRGSPTGQLCEDIRLSPPKSPIMNFGNQDFGTSNTPAGALLHHKQQQLPSEEPAASWSISWNEGQPSVTYYPRTPEEEARVAAYYEGQTAGQRQAAGAFEQAQSQQENAPALPSSSSSVGSEAASGSPMMQMPPAGISGGPRRPMGQAWRGPTASGYEKALARRAGFLSRFLGQGR